MPMTLLQSPSNEPLLAVFAVPVGYRPRLHHLSSLMLNSTYAMILWLDGRLRSWIIAAIVK